MKRVACTAMIVGLLAAPRTAAAYHGGQSFGVSANDGGGGGVFFTGAHRWKRYDCSICHVDGPGAISVELESVPPELISQGEWEPGRSYDVIVRMLGETRGFDAMSNINTFVADFTTQAATPVGSFDFDAELLDAWDEGRVIGSRGIDGLSEWRFQFVAPAAGTGAFSLNVAIVDGDGAENAGTRAVDVVGDDVATRTVWLCEKGTPCSRQDAVPTQYESPAVSGCSITASPRSGRRGDLFLVLLVAAAVRRARNAGDKRRV